MQTEAMLNTIDHQDLLAPLLDAVELDQLRSLLHCARACAAKWCEGEEDGAKKAELIARHHCLADTMLAVALKGGWGGGVPDLRGVLINRLFESPHPYLSHCEQVLPSEIPQALNQSMRRHLQYAEVLAGPSWGFYLQPIAADAGIVVGQMPGHGVEPAAVENLKERFYSGQDWPDLVGQMGRLIYEYGRGDLRRYAGFRIGEDGAKCILEPIRDFASFPLEWLEGNEARIEILEENTRNFLSGQRSHNVLVWGPRGGGKSTLIRAIIGKFYDSGLRALEITPSCYQDLSQIFALVRGRKQRFIGVLDNVSLDRGDGSLHLLSRVLDGGLEEWPKNLVFYATSNYKDLVDREGERPLGLGQMQMDDQHSNLINQSIRPEFYDPQQLQRLDEERALDDRFALKVFLDLPQKNQYQHMIVSYAHRAGIDIPEEDLLASFEVWRMRHNHDLVGGRTVRDFILAQMSGGQRRRED